MQIDPQPFDYENSTLIRPPFKDLQNKEITNKITRIVLDSRDRNRDIFPSPSQYELQLPDDIEEVTSIELVAADVPIKGGYNVSSTYNTMYVDNIMIQIPIGDYNGFSLASEVEKALQAAFPTSDFKATYKGSTFASAYDYVILNSYTEVAYDKITITANTQFTLQSGLLMKVLGFNHLQSYTSNSSNILFAPYKINLMDNRYVVLNIDNVSLNNSINPILHKSLAMLNNNMMSYNFVNNTTKLIKYLNPPIARLTKIKVTFKDYYGNVFDFQNHDNRIELILESRKHLTRFR